MGKPTRRTKNEPLGCKYLLQFDGVLQRFPSITQANSQVCLNLSIIFGLFQYDELRYCAESIFKWKKKKFSVHGKCPNFSMLLRLRT